MGQPKLIADAEAWSARFSAGVFDDPKAIAQRLAHSPESQQAALRRTDPPKLSQPVDARAALGKSASAAVRWIVQPRLLATALILAALVPCLILAVIWARSSSEVQPRTAAALDPQTIAPSAVLTASDRIEAVAGEQVNFPIALDGTDGIPPRSVIAISGLPPGSNFSEGRPYGESEWNLRPDQIGDLSLALPAGATGEFELSLALIAPDDRVIAEAETLVVVSTPVPPPQPFGAEGSSLTSPAAGEMPAAALHGGEATVPNSPEAGAAADNPENASEMTPPLAPADPAGVDTAALEETAANETASVPSRAAPPDQADALPAGTSERGTVQPSVFVNLREGPSSSSPVLGVIAKGAELPVLDRKRGWVQVAHPETGKQGWIYSGLLVGEAKANHRVKRVAPPEAEAKSETFWGRLGRWLSPSKEDAQKKN